MKINESFENDDNKMKMINLGSLKYETPVNHFLKNHYNKDISCYISHHEVIFNQDSDKQFIFLLNEDILLTNKFEYDGRDLINEVSYNNWVDNHNLILMKIGYKTVYSVDIEITNENKNLIMKLISSDNFTNLLNVQISFSSLKELFIVNHLIEKQKILNWQSFFESKIPIQFPFYYQKHFFLQKVNERGKQQSRVIVFSNKFIMNVSFNVKIRPHIQFEIECQKWGLAIESIKALSVSKKKPLTIILTLDKTINKKVVEENKIKLKNKSEREFIFYSELDLKVFIFQCRRLFNQLKNSFLFVNMS